MNGYSDFDFPFVELAFPSVNMELEWDLDELPCKPRRRTPTDRWTAPAVG